MSSPTWSIHNNRTMVTVEDLSTDEALSILRAEQPSELQFWFAWREGMNNWNPVVTVSELDLNVPAPKAATPEAPPPSALPEPLKQLRAPPETPLLESSQPAVRMNDEGQLMFDFGEVVRSEQADPDFEIYWMSEEGEPEKASIQDARPSSKTVQLSVVQNGSSEISSQPTQEFTEKDRRKYPRIDVRLKVLIQNDNITFRTYSRNASLGGLALEVAIPPLLMGQACLIHVTEPQSRETIRMPGRLVANREQTRYFSFFRASAESITKLQKWLQAVSELKRVS